MIPRDLTDRLKRWQQRRAWKKDVQRLENNAQKPRPIPRPIPGSLKTPLRPESGWDRQAQSLACQRSSSLLTNLTLDIRCQIYQMIFDNQCLHIVQKCNRLGFLFCSRKGDESHLKSGCWGVQNIDGTFRYRYRAQGYVEPRGMPSADEFGYRTRYTTDGRILPLLLICRFMYWEVVSMLYVTSTFAFRGRPTFNLFHSIVSPHHLNSIRKLYIETVDREPLVTISTGREGYQPDFPEFTEWIRFWEPVGQLKALKSLEVKILDVPGFWYEGLAKYLRSKHLSCTNVMLPEDFGLLEPLRTMRHLDRFQVTVPQWCRAPLREDEPFQLTYREDGDC